MKAIGTVCQKLPSLQGSQISRSPGFKSKKGHTKVIVELTHDCDPENICMQYESN